MTEHELLMRWLKNDADAVKFCEAVFYISQVYDDAVDGDRPITVGEIHAAFWAALVEIPRNAFYQKHREFLQPLLQASLVDWMDANELQRGSDHDKNIAFVLRDSVSALAIHCAELVGGEAWRRTVSCDLRRVIFDETLVDYKQRLIDERV